MTFRRSLLCLAPVLLWSISGEAAFERLPQGPRCAALGILGLPGINAARVLPGPSGLHCPRQEASVFIAPRLYGCEGLSYGGVSTAVPWLSGMLTVAGTRFGSAAYREYTVTTGFFLPLSGRFAAGGVVHAYHLSITGYGQASSLGVDAAMAASFGEVVTYYCSLLNLNAPTIGAVRERLPQALVSGLIIQPARFVSLSLELSKDLSNDLELHAGAECPLAEGIGLRAGVAPSTATYGAGCIVGYGALAVEYALTVHRELGATHWFSVRWEGE